MQKAASIHAIITSQVFNLMFNVMATLFTNSDFLFNILVFPSGFVKKSVSHRYKL